MNKFADQLALARETGEKLSVIQLRDRDYLPAKQMHTIKTIERLEAIDAKVDWLSRTRDIEARLDALQWESNDNDLRRKHGLFSLFWNMAHTSFKDKRFDRFIGWYEEILLLSHEIGAFAVPKTYALWRVEQAYIEYDLLEDPACLDVAERYAEYCD